MNDFLCEEEKVLGRFNCDSYDNAELDIHSTTQKDLLSGQVIELPLWLAIKLC
jgi:hypothetical protein